MSNLKKLDSVISIFLLALFGIFLLNAIYNYIIEEKTCLESNQSVNKLFLEANVPPVYSESLGLRTITGYSSEICQTDSTPFITAYNTKVREGIIASNEFDKGTYLSINGKTYIVEDKMNKRYDDELDIWFLEKEEAINFGRQLVEVYLLK